MAAKAASHVVLLMKHAAQMAAAVKAYASVVAGEPARLSVEQKGKIAVGAISSTAVCKV